MDVNLGELEVRFDANGSHLVLEVLNYLSNTSPKIPSIGQLRDGECLIKVISLFERQTRWQSSRVIDLFFKYKNDVITGYEFIDGWLDCYYSSGFVIVTDGFRFATDHEVMTIAVLVLNVLYIKRDSLTYDLKIRLEALWIDFSSTIDSIVLWMRTRAQLNDCNTGLHSCAHQLFSHHSLQEYQSIQQRLTQLAQQKLINDQMKRLEEKDALMRKQAKELSDLGTKMFALIGELNETKSTSAILATEVKWQMSANKELNQTVAKLQHENQVLKQLALKNHSFLFMDSKSKSAANGAHISTDASIDAKPELDANEPISGSNVDNSCNEINLTTLSLNDSPKGTSDRNEDTDSSTEIEDITDSGNHSDAATDDLLLELCQTISPKGDSNAMNTNEKIDCTDTTLPSNSWEQYFANESNNTNDLNVLSDISDTSVQNSDTYNKSNHSLGTNDNTISALTLN
ncbi:unnamed protein product [Medioppia subpectinata]|uniref:Uncharacterized protein n=1 Tax=Medioppia subpectinata TaxID=1979941 RepID=A0A7R9PTV3_9ACAR|nr:unnamed protein product [Medioppia subpectinata]CAG2100117.1 unnamed protein product [Medioppia subpectinata]